MPRRATRRSIRRRARKTRKARKQRGGDLKMELDGLIKNANNYQESLDFLATIEHPCIHLGFPNFSNGTYNVLIKGEPHEGPDSESAERPIIFINASKNGNSFTAVEINLWNTSPDTITGEYSDEPLVRNLDTGDNRAVYRAILEVMGEIYGAAEC